MDSFTSNIKRLVQLQDDLKIISTYARDKRLPVKEEYEVVQGEIIKFMKDAEIDVCNFNDEKIELREVSRQGSLNRKSLQAALQSYFADDPAKASGCFEHIIQSLGTIQVDQLRRVKKRKKKDQGNRSQNKTSKTLNFTRSNHPAAPGALTGGQDDVPDLDDDDSSGDEI